MLWSLCRSDNIILQKQQNVYAVKVGIRRPQYACTTAVKQRVLRSASHAYHGRQTPFLQPFHYKQTRKT